MFKLSEIISKPVYSLYEGTLVGTVVGIVLNKTKKIKAFVVLSIDEDVKSVIYKKDVFVLNENCLLIRNVSKLSENAFDETKLIGKRVLTFDGETFGNIKEVFFDENFYMLSAETSHKGVINSNAFMSFGVDACFVSFEKKVSISRFKPKNFVSSTDLNEIKVSILNKKSESKIETIGEAKEKNSGSVPIKIAKNPSFLIGRKSAISIKDQNGEYIVRAGEIITEKIISKAQINNKIYELSTSAN